MFSSHTTLPAKLATMHVYVPTSFVFALKTVYVSDIAPGISTPFIRHWNFGRGVPDNKLTDKLTLSPFCTTTLTNSNLTLGNMLPHRDCIYYKTYKYSGIASVIYLCNPCEKYGGTGIYKQLTDILLISLSH